MSGSHKPKRSRIMFGMVIDLVINQRFLEIVDSIDIRKRLNFLINTSPYIEMTWTHSLVKDISINPLLFWSFG